MSAGMETTEKAREKRQASEGLARWARRYGLQIGILTVGIVIWILFVIGAPRTFLSPRIYNAFMSSTPFFALMALPLTMVIIAAEIDLSFPSIMSLGVMGFSLVLTATGNTWLALIGCLVAGFIAGWLNGVIVVRLGIPALVATIGTQFLWRGVVLIVTNGTGTSLVPVRDTVLYGLLVGRGLGIPSQMIWTIIFAVAVWLFLNRTRPGAHLYLVGDNTESARLMGVDVDQRKIMVFTLMGIAAAFAGLIASMEVSYYWPTLGDGYLLRTLSSVFLGGTSVFGGTGTVFGTFIGAFIIGAIEAGIVAVGLTGFWTQFIYGLIIVISVAIQMLLSRRLA